MSSMIENDDITINFPIFDLNDPETVKGIKKKVNDNSFNFISVSYNNSNTDNNTINLLINANNNSTYSVDYFYIIGNLSSYKDSKNTNINKFFDTYYDKKVKNNKIKNNLLLHLNLRSNSDVVKVSQAFMCFPLVHIDNSGGNNDIYNILSSNTDADTSESNYYLNNITSQLPELESKKITLNMNDLINKNDFSVIIDTSDPNIDNYLYFYNHVFSVYKLNSFQTGEYSWINKFDKTLNKANPDIQSFFKTLNSPSNSKSISTSTTVTSTKEKIMDGDQIYINCAPAGASEETVPTNQGSNKNPNDPTHSNVYIMMFFTVMISMGLVYTNQELIYNSLSDPFKKTIGISSDSKKETNLVMMYLKFIIDTVPYLGEWINNSVFFDESNKINRDYKVPTTIATRIAFFIFYFLILFFTFYQKSSTEIKQAFMFVLLILIFSQLLFFTLMIQRGDF